ncbi:MAG: hypothetical protein ACRC6V_16395 [Bacteroidales bacterium]
MSNGSSSVVSGIAIAALSAGLMGGFNIYTDTKIMKEQIVGIERTMEEREETTRRFTLMMNQMDKTLAVQTEAVNTLKKAVERLEGGSIIAVNYSQEIIDDR